MATYGGPARAPSRGPSEVFEMIYFNICGPKGSTCCTMLSIWGFIMLMILGGAMKLQAVALFEDISIPPDSSGTDEEKVKHAYDNAALSCFIAAGVYLGCLTFSGIMMAINIFRSRAAKRSVS